MPDLAGAIRHGKHSDGKWPGKIPALKFDLAGKGGPAEAHTGAPPRGGEKVLPLEGGPRGSGGSSDPVGIRLQGLAAYELAHYGSGRDGSDLGGLESHDVVQELKEPHRLSESGGTG